MMKDTDAVRHQRLQTSQTKTELTTKMTTKAKAMKMHMMMKRTMKLTLSRNHWQKRLMLTAQRSLTKMVARESARDERHQ